MLQQPSWEITKDSASSHKLADLSGAGFPVARESVSGYGNSRSLRLIACGSVDDGKSTLIGRLLWDTRSVSSDHADILPDSTLRDADGSLIPEFAMLLDGLQAEREQGITIDVSYRYFSTAERSFIVADTPGHEQYTRNMATGCSTADIALLLVDARSGLLAQTRRHMSIAALMGIDEFVLVVNKIDLIDYDEGHFRRIAAEFETLARKLGVASVSAVPTSALRGLNVVAGAGHCMPWYKGPTLLELIEKAEPRERGRAPLRLPVQRVSRPDEGFRGYQGTLASGVVQPGDPVVVLPSGQEARVEQIVTFDGPQFRAVEGDAVTLMLDRPLDISRGDLIVALQDKPLVSKSFDARAVSLAGAGLVNEGRYWLKSASHMQKVQIQIRSRLELDTGGYTAADRLSVNQIGEVCLHFSDAATFDTYGICRDTGSFILIDPQNNNTIAAGMIAGRGDNKDASGSQEPSGEMVLTLPLALGEQVLRSPLLLEHPDLIRIRRMPIVSGET